MRPRIITINPFQLTDEERVLFHKLLISHAEQCESNPNYDRKLLKSQRKNDVPQVQGAWVNKLPRVNPDKFYLIESNHIYLNYSIFYVAKEKILDGVIAGLGWQKEDVLMFTIPQEALASGAFGTVKRQMIYYLNQRTGEYKCVPFALKELKYSQANERKELKLKTDALKIQRLVEEAQKEDTCNQSLYLNSLQPGFYLHRKQYQKTIEIDNNGWHPAKAYLGMPFIEGDTVSTDEETVEVSLLSRLQEPDNFHRFCSLLYRAVQRLHAKNIVHHDLKPANYKILFSNGKVVDIGVVDGGLAEALDSDGVGEKGTPSYVDFTTFLKIPGYNNQQKDFYAYVVCVLSSVLKHEKAVDVFLTRNTPQKMSKNQYYQIQENFLIDELLYKEEWTDVLNNLLGPYMRPEARNQRQRAMLPENPEQAFEALQAKIALLESHENFKEPLNSNPIDQEHGELADIIDSIKTLTSAEKSNPIYYLVLRKKLQKALSKWRDLPCLQHEDVFLELIDAFNNNLNMKYNENLKRIDALQINIFNALIINLKVFPENQNDNITKIYQEIASLKNKLVSGESFDFEEAKTTCIEKVKECFLSLNISVDNTVFDIDNPSDLFLTEVAWFKDILQSRMDALKKTIFWLEAEINTQKTKESVLVQNLRPVEQRLQSQKARLRMFEEKSWQWNRSEMRQTPSVFFDIISSLPPEEKEILQCSLPANVAEEAQAVPANFNVHEILSTQIQAVDELFEVVQSALLKQILKETMRKLLSLDERWSSLTEAERHNKHVLNMFHEKITQCQANIENNPFLKNMYMLSQVINEKLQSNDQAVVLLAQKAKAVEHDILMKHAQEEGGYPASQPSVYHEALDATKNVLSQPTSPNINTFHEKIAPLTQDHSPRSEVLKASASSFIGAALMVAAVVPAALVVTLSLSPMVALGCGLSIAMIGLGAIVVASHYASKAAAIQSDNNKIKRPYTLFGDEGKRLVAETLSYAPIRGAP